MKLTEESALNMYEYQACLDLEQLKLLDFLGVEKIRISGAVSPQW